MAPALLISAALALCIVLPPAASAREHRSAAVKHEFQLTHPCPATGLTSGACPGYVKDHIVPLVCGGPDERRECEGTAAGTVGHRVVIG